MEKTALISAPFELWPAGREGNLTFPDPYPPPPPEALNLLCCRNRSTLEMGTGLQGGTV